MLNHELSMSWYGPVMKQSLYRLICEEAIKSEFLAEDEDWVWKNATNKDDRVCFRSLHSFLWLLIFFDRYTVRYAIVRLCL